MALLARPRARSGPARPGPGTGWTLIIHNTHRAGPAAQHRPRRAAHRGGVAAAFFSVTRHTASCRHCAVCRLPSSRLRMIAASRAGQNTRFYSDTIQLQQCSTFNFELHYSTAFEINTYFKVLFSVVLLIHGLVVLLGIL